MKKKIATEAVTSKDVGTLPVEFAKPTPPVKLRIFLGWDSNQRLAYDVARHSILRHAKEPNRVYIRPLELPHLQKWLADRPIERKDGKLWDPVSQAPMATEFAISRFVVPFLQDKGWALFADSDVLVTTDIAELFALADDRYAVMVVKHQQERGSDTKMDGQVQTYYSRKNWSSVMLFQCGHPSHKALTLEALTKWPGRDLHAFKWLKDEEIGELPPEWNYLVDVNPPPIVPPKLVHYTLGTPNIPGYETCTLNELWREELTLMKPELARKLAKKKEAVVEKEQ